MVKVLITGSTGQVGSELIKMAPSEFEVRGFKSSELDITNAQQVQQVIANYAPALIINAAAYTAVDKAESDTELAYAVNETGIDNLAQTALSLDIPIFHISTDYVFDGEATVPYKETDPINPTGVYGASKLAGEQILASHSVKYIILRTSWVFSAVGNNFVKTMLRLGQERNILGVVADQYGCPTSASSIANVLWQLAQKYIEDGKLPWGIYHFSNSPLTSWHGFAREIFTQAVEAGFFDNAPIVNEINTTDYPTPANRPAWSVMDSSKLENLLGFSMVSWQHELSIVLKQLNYRFGRL